jgi:hypothetical protein
MPAKPRKSKGQLPAHLPGTVVEWRKKKRQQLAAFEIAFWRLVDSSAWTPIDTDLVFDWLLDARRKLKGNWNPVQEYELRNRRVDRIIRRMKKRWAEEAERKAKRPRRT